MIRNARDAWSGAFSLCVGAATVWLSRAYDFGVARRMGPGYFPTVLGAILALLGLAIAVRGLRGSRETVTPIAFGPMAAVLGGATAFGILLIPAGLVVATVALVVIASTPKQGARLFEAAALGLLLAAGSSLLFSWLLGQPLPILGQLFAR